jgi:hypothetical protein
MNEGQRLAAVLATAAVVGLAGCGGPASSTPPVASLPRGSGTASGSPTAGKSATAGVARSKGNATELLDEWAGCMRRHGDPGQTDPTIDASDVIHISVPAGATAGVLPSGQNPRSGLACIKYLSSAQSAVRGDKPFPARASLAQQLKYSRCMRARGISGFPDPSAGGGIQAHPGGDLNPSSPAFQSASKACARKTGVPGLGGGALPAGAIEVGGGPAGNGVGFIVTGPLGNG